MTQNPGVGTSEYGEGWWIDGLDRLVPGDGTASSQINPASPPSPSSPPSPEVQGLPTDSGFALIRGDNTSAWYEATPLFNSTGQTFQIVDPSSPNFSTTGTWQADTDQNNEVEYDDSGYDFGDPFLYANSSSASATANWTLTDLAQQRMVQVFVAWTPDADRTDDAQYTVNATPVGSPSTNDLTTIDVDQQYTSGTLEFDGVYCAASAITTSAPGVRWL